MSGSASPSSPAFANFLTVDPPKRLYYSTESTVNNEELVRQAILRRKRASFTVSDLFNLFAPLDTYFKVSAVLTGLIWSPQVLEFVIEMMLETPDSYFEFKDCDDTSYNDHKRRPLRNVTKVELDRVSYKFLTIITNLFSPLISLFFYKTSIRTAQLFFSIVGILKWIFVLTQKPYFVDVSRLVTPFIITSYKIIVLRYMSSSMPYNLLVFCFFCVEMTQNLMFLGVAVFLKHMNEWSKIPFLLIFLYLCSSLIFYFTSPDPVLQSLVQKNSFALQQIIQKYTGIEQFDADGLIDDVLYRNGNLIDSDDPTISIKAYFERAHLVRQLAYIMYHVVMHILLDLLLFYATRWVTIDIFSSILMAIVCWTSCCVFAAFLLHQFRARKTLWIGCLVSCIGLLLIEIRPERGLINVCQQYPNFVHIDEYTCLLFIGMICTALGSTIFRISSIQMICNFFPVQHHAILFPIHYFGCNVAKAILGTLEEVFHRDKNSSCALECAVLVVLLGVISAFMESEHNWTVVTSSDVLKLRVISSEYPEYPDGDDDTYYDVTDVPLKSKKGDPLDDSLPKEKAVKMFHGVKRKRSTPRFSDTATTEESPAKPSPPTRSNESPIIRTESTQESKSFSSDTDCISTSITSSEKSSTTPTCSKEDADNRYAVPINAIRQIASDP